MQSPLRPLDKITRAITFARHLHLLGPMPCGCTPRLAGCNCSPTCCHCPVEVTLCRFESLWGTANETPVALEHREAWDPDACAPLEAQLERLYLAVDPWSYCDRPKPDRPIPFISRSLRIEAMAERVAAGLSPFHRGKDLEASSLKVGETLHNARNGATVYRGLAGSAS